MSPAQRAALEAIAGTRSLEAQQVLFHEEDPCTGFYVLVEGAIQLTRAGDAPSAHPTLAVVLPVASFAEAAMFGDEAFPATQRIQVQLIGPHGQRGEELDPQHPRLNF